MLTRTGIVIILMVSLAAGATYYVAPDGSNTHTAAQAQNVATPWQSIGYGVRSLKPGDLLQVRGGVYRELVNVAVQGETGARITIENYPGETPVVDGSQPVTGWQRCTATEAGLTVGGRVNPNYGKIWKAEIPKRYLKSVYKGYLFENGRFLSPACDPDQSDADIVKIHEGALVPQEGGNIGNKNFLVDTKRFTQGTNGYWKGAFVRIHMKNLTSRTITRTIAGYDPAARKITFDTPLDAGLHETDRYYIYNHPHTLNKAGEFFYTTTPVNDMYTVYLWPRSEASLTGGISIAYQTYGFRLDSRQWITVQGFEVRNTRQYGIYANACQNSVVRGCHIHSHVGTGYHQEAATDMRVEGCVIEHIRSEDTDVLLKGQGIRVQGGSRLQVVGTRVWQSEHSAIYYGGGLSHSILDRCLVPPWVGGVHNRGISIYTSCHDILVVNTRTSTLRFNTVKDITVYNSIFTSGIQSWGGMTGTTLILNNVVLGNFNGYSLWGDMAYEIFHNNIILNKHHKTPAVSDYNIYLKSTSSQNKPHDQVADGTALFADFNGGDYHLKSGCAAVNAGKDITGLLPKSAFPAFPFNQDFDGNARISGTAIDIGPYEWSANPTKVRTPSFSPAGGTYVGSVQVQISCATSGAAIRYTTNGSTPTSSSPAYSSPITITSTSTVKAKAFKSGMTDSDVASAAFTIQPASGLHLKINCGPGTVSGWERDDNYVSGGNDYTFAETSVDLNKATDPGPAALYQTVRHLEPTFTFGQIPNGDYRVRLHYKDGDDTDGGRKMVITIEGRTVESAFNIRAEAGAAWTAVVKEYPVTVADGNGLKIEYSKGTGNDAFVSGIEVIAETQNPIADFQLPIADFKTDTPDIPAALFDLRGRRVDLRDAPAGVYFLRGTGKAPDEFVKHILIK